MHSVVVRGSRGNLKTHWRRYARGVIKQSRARTQNSQATESITDTYSRRTA
ncbi:hypothetical protein QUA54_29190 [Microcoleus sp. MOSTC5]|uniref:hypothetical protein n=1 Tax=Microcoleus sp. MOSTC5 TaxID=3055378 RepID=UPI002FD28C52